MNRVLVTGSNGFVGGALCDALRRAGIEVVSGVRTKRHADEYEVGNLSGTTDWTAALKECDAVIHLAARVHMLEDKADDPLAEFRAVNVDATLNLARQAANSGVNRFIFISSIGVNGAESSTEPFSERSIPQPHSAYAVSKAEAEQALTAECAETGMEFVIIRPPLVYGSRAPGNFRSLLQIVHKGLPLPLGSVNNRRSMVCLDNLVDFIMLCVISSKAANQLFVVADGSDVSTPQLLKLLSEGMGKKSRLLPFPAVVLKLGAALVGRRNVYQQLCGSLQVDAAKAGDLLGWVPPVTVYEGLRTAARGYLNEKTV